MAQLEAFLSSGHAADLILLIVLLEGVLLTWRYLRGSGTPPGRWLSPLVAGAALVLALRVAITGGPLPVVGVALAVAGAAHLAGYRQRWIS